MCITVLPSELRGTKIALFAGDPTNPETSRDRLLIYENQAKDLSKGKGNAMILPIPADYGDIEVLDFPRYDKMLENLFLDFLKNSGSKSEPSRSMRPFKVLGTSSYLFVFLDNLSEDFYFEDAMTYFEDMGYSFKLTQEDLSFYTRYYPEHTLVCCLFKNPEEEEKSPIVLKYKTTERYEYFGSIPLVDAHDGDLPDVGGDMPEGMHQKICIGVMGAEHHLPSDIEVSDLWSARDPKWFSKGGILPEELETYVPKYLYYRDLEEIQDFMGNRINRDTYRNLDMVVHLPTFQQYKSSPFMCISSYLTGDEVNHEELEDDIVEYFPNSNMKADTRKFGQVDIRVPLHPKK